MPQHTGYEQCAHLYDLSDTKDNVSFFGAYAAQVEAIIDIGAGTGRIAFPLAERGCRAVCVEPSPAMRTQCEKKLAARPDLNDRVTILAGDAATFDLGWTFRAAFMSGSFDHLLTVGERRPALANIARHLELGGLLVFDVFLGLMRNSPLEPAGQAREGEREHRRYVGARLLPDRQMEITLVFETYVEGILQERIEERSVVGLTDCEEVRRLLNETGFLVEREFSDYRFTPYRADNPLLIVGAQRLAHPAHSLDSRPDRAA